MTDTTANDHGPSPRPVAYAVGLKASAARVEHSQPSALVRRLLHEYGRAQIYEWYQASLIGKVAFDVDGKASSTTATDLLTHALDGVRAFFHPDPPPRILISSSHGGEKLSYRIYCVGVRMLIGDVKRRILRLKLDSRTGGPFDPAIYSANQKLRTTGSIKTSQDTRVLKLIDDQHRDVQPTLELLLDTLVQVVDDDWPLLEEPVEGARTTRKRTAVAPVEPPVTTTVTTAETTTETTAETTEETRLVPPAKRGRPMKADTLPSEWKDMLESCGFTEVKSQKAFGNDRGTGYSFSSTSRRECPCCTRPHDSNNWFAVRLRDGTFLIKSHSDNCRYKKVNPAAQDIVLDNTTIQQKVDGLELAAPVRIDPHSDNRHYHTLICYRPECLSCDEVHGSSTYRLAETIKDTCWILQNHHATCCGKVLHAGAMLPQYVNAVLRDPSHTSLATLFLAGHEQALWCDKAQTDIRMWTGERWSTTTPREFVAHVGAWLNTVLGCVKQMEAYATRAKHFKEAQGLCRSFTQQQGVALNILSIISGRVGHLKFDQDPRLLGCDDCVIELDSGHARAARREDMVSKSVGYPFLQHAGDSEGLGLVRQLMEDIYPVEEERDFMQRFAGYCLLGDYTEKTFLLLTDHRGGYTGKSTYLRLLMRALRDGEYAVKGKPTFVYQEKTCQSINAHDGGILFFRGMRMCYFEELSDKQTLNKDRLKDLTGGGTSVPVRAVHSPTTELMPWTAKIVLAFNHGDMPRFRATDEALTRRMVVMRHRSHFAKDQADYDRLSEEPYTFKADPTREAAIQPAHMLSWMLEGLERYRQVGIKEAPSSCEAWKRALILEHDDVAAWAAEHLERKDDAWALLRDIVENFHADTGLTHIRSKALNVRLQALFPGAFHVHKRLPDEDPQQHMQRKSGVYWGLRLVNG